MSEARTEQAFWKLAEAMGMEPDAFRNKYQLDAPFHALVTVALVQVAAAVEENGRLRGQLQRAERVEEAVHEALEQLDQGMPLLAGVTLLLAVVEAPPAAALGGDRR